MVKYIQHEFKDKKSIRHDDKCIHCGLDAYSISNINSCGIFISLYRIFKISFTKKINNKSSKNCLSQNEYISGVAIGFDQLFAVICIRLSIPFIA